MADNLGSRVTARKISDYLKSQKIKVSHNLVSDYLSYLSNAMLVLRARRCDIGGKKIFEIGEKYYFENLGIRHALVGFRATDINKILENLVFMHLKSAWRIFCYPFEGTALSGTFLINYIYRIKDKKIFDNI